MGIISLGLNNLENAMASLEKSLELKMDYDKCILAIGNVLLKQGKYVEGLKRIKDGEGVINFHLKNGMSIN